MTRTKIQFKALRECVGLTQQDVASILGVNAKSVKRWEGSTYPAYHAPEEAWELLEDMFAAQQSAIKTAADIVAEQTEVAGRPPATVTLKYWRSQSDYAQYGRDCGAYGVANANSRAVARFLAVNKLCGHVQFVEGAEEAPSVDINAYKCCNTCKYCDITRGVLGCFRHTPNGASFGVTYEESEEEADNCWCDLWTPRHRGLTYEDLYGGVGEIDRVFESLS